jgi:AbrB family looped-hinge helix DNA binding protein
METVIARVSTKGQLVIPAAIRQQLGIRAGTRVTLRVDGGQMILDPQNVESKLRRIKTMRGYTAGGPSGTDLLLEDRRIERERELRKEGF